MTLCHVVYNCNAILFTFVTCSLELNGEHFSAPLMASEVATFLLQLLDEAVYSATERFSVFW